MHMVSKRQIVDKCDKLADNFPHSNKSLDKQHHDSPTDSFVRPCHASYCLHTYPAPVHNYLAPNNRWQFFFYLLFPRTSKRTHLLNVALHERAAEHGRHPVAAGDEQRLVGRKATVVNAEHYIWNRGGKRAFISWSATEAQATEGGKDRRGRRPDVRAHTSRQKTHTER